MNFPRTFVALVATSGRSMIRTQPLVNHTYHLLPLPLTGVRGSSRCAVLQVRCLSTSRPAFDKPSSKIEETVQHLKEGEEKPPDKASEEDVRKPERVPGIAEPAAVKPAKPAEAVGQVEPVKKTLWQRVVDECKHYYSGFKLLFLEVRVSSKLVWKILNGHQLSRRESKQLVRTTSDLFRCKGFLNICAFSLGHYEGKDGSTI